MDHDDDDPVDAYTPHIEALRAAGATPASTFAERFANMRRRELAGEDDEVAALRAAHEARSEPLTDLSRYDPPNPWAAGILALQAKETR